MTAAPAGHRKLSGSSWPPADLVSRTQVATFDGHSGNITSLAWHCDAKWLVTGSEDGTLKIWDTRCVETLFGAAP
jgi:G protein beta subunit-like protein